MEKIYMDDNHSQKNKSWLFNFSIVLSFAIAIFAVFSLATFGVVMNQGTDAISYAAPAGTTGDTFTMDMPLIEGQNIKVQIFDEESNGGNFFNVPLYYANTTHTLPVFCVEHSKNAEHEAVYTKDGVVEDYGLLYILNNSAANGVDLVGDAIPDGYKSYANALITQTAIWVYLSETHADKADHASHDLSQENLNVIKNAKRLSFTTGTPGTYDLSVADMNLYNTYIAPLVTAAKAASGVKKLSVSINSDSLSKTDDGKFYLSDVITVNGNPAKDLISYDVTISGVEEATIVDENGEALSATNITPGKKFRVKVPAEKVTETVQTATVNVKGRFNTLTGNYYTSGNLQKVVSVTGTTTDVSDGVTVEFVGAPDTGMNAAQTIYFIGLIVLLCGVGIVYANAKPVESKQ